MLFGLPAVWPLATERKRWRAFTAGAALAILCVYVPLSRHRAEGGTNFWRPTTTDSVFAFDTLREGWGGAPLRALERMRAQLTENVSVFRRGLRGALDARRARERLAVRSSTLPGEVLSTPPPDFEGLFLLQRNLWFDYVAAAPHCALAK